MKKTSCQKLMSESGATAESARLGRQRAVLEHRAQKVRRFGALSRKEWCRPKGLRNLGGTTEAGFRPKGAGAAFFILHPVPALSGSKPKNK
jgi:hypothetical protein